VTRNLEKKLRTKILERADEPAFLVCHLSIVPGVIGTSSDR
jgi:hypothetical protein